MTSFSDLSTWAEAIPTAVLFMLEDWGYFLKDITLKDALNVTEYLLKRLEDNGQDDYYAELKNTDYPEYLKIKEESLSFLQEYTDHL